MDEMGRVEESGVTRQGSVYNDHDWVKYQRLSGCE